MPRYDEQVAHDVSPPSGGDQSLRRHWGDGSAGLMRGARVQGYDSSTLSYVDIAVASDGTVKTVGGGGGGGGAVTIADGADVAEGATTDVAIISDTTGTVSGKLRGLVKWAFERMPASLGQKAMAASLPVVVASDQSAVPVSGSGVFHVDDNAGSLTVDGTVSIPANSSVNVAQVAGAATDTNSGLKSTGTQRVVLATDQPQLTNALKVDGSAVTQPVSGTVTANQGGSPWGVNPTAETAGIGVGAAADAEASGNGSVIALLKRLRTLLAGGLPSSLVGGRLDSNTGSWLGSTAPTVGSKTSANSVPVVVASDQAAIPVTVAGTVSVSESPNAADGSTTKPSTDLISGWDDLTVRAVTVRQRAGDNLLYTTDPLSKQVLEQLLLLVQQGLPMPQLPFRVSLDQSILGGYTVFRLLAAATTNANLVKATNGAVFGWFVANLAAAARYLKLYDSAVSPTVGTDRPLLTIPLQGSSGANVEFVGGIEFRKGIALAVTTGVADTDTGACSLNDLVLNLLYR